MFSQWFAQHSFQTTIRATAHDSSILDAQKVGCEEREFQVQAAISIIDRQTFKSGCLMIVDQAAFQDISITDTELHARNLVWNSVAADVKDTSLNATSLKTDTSSSAQK